MSKFDNGIFTGVSLNLMSFDDKLGYRLFDKSFSVHFGHSFSIGLLSFTMFLILASYTLLVVRIMHTVNRSHCRSHLKQE